jgi:RNA recognition motif-containing protein
MKARDAFEEIGEEEGELVTSGEENGDRETNYPTVVEPPEEAKVYIGNLPCDDVDSEGLTQLFKQGSVVEIMELRLLSLSDSHSPFNRLYHSASVQLSQMYWLVLRNNPTFCCFATV